MLEKHRFTSYRRGRASAGEELNNKFTELRRLYMQQKTFDLNSLNGANGFTVPSVPPTIELGYSLDTAGDINGDGVSDLVLGTNYNLAYVIFGNAGGFESSFNLTWVCT